MIPVNTLFDILIGYVGLIGSARIVSSYVVRSCISIAAEDRSRHRSCWPNQDAETPLLHLSGANVRET